MGSSSSKHRDRLREAVKAWRDIRQETVEVFVDGPSASKNVKAWSKTRRVVFNRAMEQAEQWERVCRVLNRRMEGDPALQKDAKWLDLCTRATRQLHVSTMLVCYVRHLDFVDDDAFLVNQAVFFKLREGISRFMDAHSSKAYALLAFFSLGVGACGGYATFVAMGTSTAAATAKLTFVSTAAAKTAVTSTATTKFVLAGSATTAACPLLWPVAIGVSLGLAIAALGAVLIDFVKTKITTKDGDLSVKQFQMLQETVKQYMDDHPGDVPPADVDRLKTAYADLNKELKSFSQCFKCENPITAFPYTPFTPTGPCECFCLLVCKGCLIVKELDEAILGPCPGCKTQGSLLRPTNSGSNKRNLVPLEFKVKVPMPAQTAGAPAAAVAPLEHLPEEGDQVV